MLNSLSGYIPPSISLSDVLLKWTPRVIVGTLAGYYSLGVAYEWGFMAKIDRIAINFLVPHVGYAGLGAIMPTFQWYAAWSVRITAAIAAGILYDLSERIFLYVMSLLFDKSDSAQSEMAPNLV